MKFRTWSLQSVYCWSLLPFTNLFGSNYFNIDEIILNNFIGAAFSKVVFFWYVCLFLYNEALNPMQPETNPNCAPTWLCNYYRMWTVFLAFTKISTYWTFQSEFKIQNWIKTCSKAQFRHPTEGVITARKRSLGQCNIFTSVCHSFCPRGGGCLHPGRLHPGGLGRPPRLLQDTVNERAVRILLECILIWSYF